MANSPKFLEIAQEWYARWCVQREPGYAAETWRQLERDALPWLGDMPIRRITAPLVLEILQRIERRGVRIPVRKVRGHVSQIMRYALRRMGYTPEQVTAHGFRAMAATCLSEQGWPSEVIERQLAHVDSNRTRAAYQRSTLLDERRKMMQAWADWLDVQEAAVLLGRM